MLEHLHIKNVALIDELDIDFGFGLNVLTGETGAGKSILIDSINFVLGERASKDFIRTGQTEASVDALISVSREGTQALMRELGFDTGEDGTLLISRTVNASAKSVCRVNGRMVNTSVLKEISTALVDIHGQHQHQSLLSSSRHIELLDRFCGDELENEKRLFADLYKTYKDILKQINSISGDENEREQLIDLLTYQTEEIKDAKLQKGEEDELMERRKVLNHTERIRRNASEALQLIYGDDTDEASAIDKLSKAMILIREISNVDGSTEALAETMETVVAQLTDAATELRIYLNDWGDDPEELEKIEERLNLIYKLKRKYGRDTEEILKFYEEQLARLKFILNSEEELIRLKKELSNAEIKLETSGGKISRLRKDCAGKIKKGVIGTLGELGMKAEFEVLFEKKDEITASGYDKVEFLISANPGEPVKQLSKIASGGEMSRVMLALKTVLADSDDIETFIFDEIDTGVSGRTAQKVAEKLALLGKKQQILCVTHLPQIASMADYHYLIEKSSDEGKTISKTSRLDYESSVEELARLIGGAKITESTIQAAGEMKKLATEVKK